MLLLGTMNSRGGKIKTDQSTRLVFQDAVERAHSSAPAMQRQGNS